MDFCHGHSEFFTSMTMELRHLRSFLEVARTGSFSRAASSLSIVQTALSRQIRQLEEELGASLFYRNGRGVVLTDAGEIFSVHARDTLERLLYAKREVSALQGDAHGLVKLGLPHSIGAVILVPLMRELKKRYERVILRIHSGNVMEELQSGQVDLAIIYDMVSSNIVSSEPLITEELFLIHHPELRSGETAITGAELATLPLILPEKHNPLRMLINQRMGDSGYALNVPYEAQSMSTMKYLVIGGEASTILPYSAAMSEVALGILRMSPITMPHITRTMALATAVNRPVDTTIKAVIRVIRDVVAENKSSFPRTISNKD